MNKRVYFTLLIPFIFSCCALDRIFIYHPSKVNKYVFEQDVFSVNVDNKTTIYGVYLKPTVSNSLNKVTIVFFYGNTESMNSLSNLSSKFLNMGFKFIMFDYRGYGKSTGTPSEEGLYQDASTVINYINSIPDIDTNNIFYIGYSLGGAVAIEASMKKKPKGLIIIGGFTSINDMVKYHSKIGIPGNWILKDKFDNLSKIPKIKVPILFLHGSEDDTVPCWMSQTNYATANAPKRLVIITGARHSDIFLHNTLYNEIKNFINSYSD